MDTRPENRLSRSEATRPRALVAMAIVAAVWGLAYAGYRAYYGFGGTAGMFGTVDSERQWRTINLAAAVILLVAAVLPVATLPLWPRVRARRVLLCVCWVVAVGCVMHGLIDDTERVLSLNGALTISYPSMWTTIDRHSADVQDLAFNETWFLIEGLLFGALGWLALGRSRTRVWWAGSAVAGIAVLTAIGLLSAFGVVGSVVVA